MIFNATIFILTIGDPIEILFTDMTSTKVIDGIIEVMISELEEQGEEIDEETITTKRMELAQGPLQIDRYTMRNSFIVNVFDKTLAKTSLLEPNLGNVFVNLIRVLAGSIRTLDASKDSILWSTSLTTSNVLIRGQTQDITTYRLWLLTESKSKLFLVQIEYSPQTRLSPDVWQDLKEMLNSFHMIH